MASKKKTANHKKTKPQISKQISNTLIGVLCVGILCVITLNFLGYTVGFHRITHYKSIPEYEHTLKQVVVSLSVANHDLSFENSLLAALPDYTKIIVLLPEDNLREITAELLSKPYFERTTLVPFQTQDVTNPVYACLNFYGDDIGRIQLTKHSPMPGGTPWAQDIFKALIGEHGELELIVPPIYRCFLKTNGHFTSDNLYISQLSTIGIHTEKTSFEFAGGNILTGKIQGKTIAFAGTDILRDNDAMRKLLPKSIPSDREIKKQINDKFNVDEVIFIGNKNKRQPEKLFHLDQAMIFLDDGEVGISHIVGKYPKSENTIALIKEAELFLSELKSKLLSLGFHVHDIDMTVQNLLHYEEYVNAIPYTDIDSGQKTLLMPIFGSKYEDKKIVEKDVSIFESLGFKVIKVRAQTTEHKGGIHCLVNVLE